MGYAVRIKDFGGLVPRASARELPDNAAQTASNLDATTREFRPLPADTQVVADTGLTNPATLYRLARVTGGAYATDMTLNWVVRAAAMSFVKGQLNDDEDERTYATFDAGTTAPRSYDVDDMVTGRHLGVPAPSTKPTITVNVVDEFSADERPAAITAAYEAVAAAIRANLTTVWVGAPYPGSATTGYVNLQDDGTADPTQGMQARVYRTSSLNGADNGTLSNSYATAGVESFSWVFDPLVEPFWATSNSSSPTWQGGSPGSYYDHICIAYTAYGRGYELDQSALGTALAAIELPGTTDGTKLLTTDQISGADGIVTRMVAHLDPDGATAGPKVQALAQKVVAIKGVLDGTAMASTTATVTAFYAKAEVTAEIAQAIENFAAAVYEAAHGAFNTYVPPLSP